MSRNNIICTKNEYTLKFQISSFETIYAHIDVFIGFPEYIFFVVKLTFYATKVDRINDQKGLQALLIF